MTKESTQIILLGCRGSGKTAFITGLSLLARANNNSDFQIITNDGETARRFRDLRELADLGKWPGPTSTMISLKFELVYKKKNFNLLWLDYPGEDLLEAMETMDFSTREAIQDYAFNSDYVIVIADPTQDLLTSVNKTPETFTRRRQDALAQAIGLLAKERLESEKPLPDIAVVISKTDVIDKIEDESIENIRQTNDVFFKQLINYSRKKNRLKIFPISVCGHLDDTTSESFPLTPQPEGYHALFNWMKFTAWWKGHKKQIIKALWAILPIMIIVGGYFGWDYNHRQTSKNIIENGSLEEVVRALPQNGAIDHSLLPILDERIARELDTIEMELSVSTTAEAYLRQRKRLTDFAGIKQHAHHRRIKDLLNLINNSMERALYSSINTAVRAGDSQHALRLISEYRSHFPSGRHIETVANMEQSISDERRATLVGQILSVRVTDRNSLSAKLGAIRQYLAAYPDEPASNRIQSAIRIAEELSAANDIRLMMKGCGFNEQAGARRHEIRWIEGRNSEASVLFKQDKKVSHSTFSEPMEISHHNWNQVKIELWGVNKYWKDKLIAFNHLDILRDFSQFDGNYRIDLRPSDYKKGNFGAWVKIQVQQRAVSGWQPISSGDLNAFGKYILPGDGWR